MFRNRTEKYIWTHYSDPYANKIVEVLKELGGEKIKTSPLANRLGVDRHVVTHLLCTLESQGQVRRIGWSGGWVIDDKPQIDVDQEIVLVLRKLLQRMNTVSSKDIAAEIGLSSRVITGHLHGLEALGKVRHVGASRVEGWFLTDTPTIEEKALDIIRQINAQQRLAFAADVSCHFPELTHDHFLDLYLIKRLYKTGRLIRFGTSNQTMWKAADEQLLKGLKAVIWDDELCFKFQQLFERVVWTEGKIKPMAISTSLGLPIAEVHGYLRDLETLKTIYRTGNSLHSGFRLISKDDTQSTLMKRVYNYMVASSERRFETHTIAEALLMSDDQIYRSLVRLEKQNLVQRVSQKSGWELVPDGKSVQTLEERILDAMVRISRHAKKVTTIAVSMELKMSDDQIFRTMDKMHQAGKIGRIGKKAGWYLPDKKP